jgi:tetratricopeptide (TPR) repeat protein
LTIWPSGLAVYYPLSPAGLPLWQPAAAFVVIALVTAIALHEASKRAYLTMGWLWFLGTLVPVIGLVQVGGQAMADRYYYIPSIGLFVAFVFGIAELATERRLGRASIAMVSAAILLLFGSLTALQINRWRDSLSLFEHSLSVTSNNLVIHFNLGHFLGRQGKYDEAMSHFAEALRIKPDFFDALFNMGVTLFELGKPTEAIVYYQRALDVKPDSAKAHMQLALALVKQNKEDDALLHFYKAAELAPGDPAIRTNLGLMLARREKLPEAAMQLKEALRLDPNSPETHNNLGLVLLMTGKPEESLGHFSTALRLKPDYAVARDNLKKAQRQIDMRQK